MREVLNGARISHPHAPGVFLVVNSKIFSDFHSHG